MITEQITLPNRLKGTVTYPGFVVFMHSPVPLLIHVGKNYSGSITVEVVTAEDTSFEQTRQLYNGDASFDLGSMMRYLAPDVTTVLDEQRARMSAVELLRIDIRIGTSLIWSNYVMAVHGVLNANESYRFNKAGSSNPVNRRLWVNFPQTFTLQLDSNEQLYYQTESGVKLLEPTSVVFGCESDLIGVLRQLADTDGDANHLLQQFEAGNAQTLGLSNYYAINTQAELVGSDEPYWIRLHPDLTPRDATGVTYLRWLQRDGSIGYWLFRSGELQTTSDAGTGFQRFLVNPNAPSYVGEFAHFDNALLADYTEARTLNLSAEIRNRDEYEYLCGLLTSPVVDRLVDSGQYQAWERVNIMPSSQSLSLRRDTPFSRTLELGVQLPRRDTIKL